MDCQCGCGRKAAPGGSLAWACYKQRKRKGTVHRKNPGQARRHKTKRERILEACLDVVEAVDLDRAIARVVMAVTYKRKRKPSNTVQKNPKTPP